MNIKDQINIISIQEQLLTLLIKTKVLESIIIEKNICSLEDYNTKLTAEAEKYQKELKPVFEQLEKLTNAIKQQQQEQAKETKKEDVQ